MAIQLALENVWKHKGEMSLNAVSLSKKYDIKHANQLWLDLYNKLINKKKDRNIENTSH